MALDPQAAAHLKKQVDLGLLPIEQITPQEARRRNEDASAALAGPGEDVRVEDAKISGVPVRIFRPHESGALPTLLYFHGGGWVIGSVTTHDRPCRALAYRASRVLAVRSGPRPWPGVLAGCSRYGYL